MNPKYHKFMRRTIEYLIYQAEFHLVLIQIMSNWPLSSLTSYQSAITKYYHSIIQYTTTSNVFLLSESIKYAKVSP